MVSSRNDIRLTSDDLMIDDIARRLDCNNFLRYVIGARPDRTAGAVCVNNSCFLMKLPIEFNDYSGRYNLYDMKCDLHSKFLW